MSAVTNLNDETHWSEGDSTCRTQKLNTLRWITLYFVLNLSWCDACSNEHLGYLKQL